jgi:hypothetical protein
VCVCVCVCVFVCLCACARACVWYAGMYVFVTYSEIHLKCPK